MTMKEMEFELENLKAMIRQKNDEDVKYRRAVEDILYNLSFLNMPEVESESQKTNSRITSVAANIDNITEGVSKIEQTVDEQGASISLVVKKSNGVSQINTAGIVSAINNSGSSIKLSADKIEFDGSSVTFDTDALKVNSSGRVSFSSALSTPEVHADIGYFQGRVDLGSDMGNPGYSYLNCGENNTLELFGDGGVVITTDSESGTSGGDVCVFSDTIRHNGYRVLTRSPEDIEYLRSELGFI